MNIQRIEYFIKISEYMSFRKASCELHISHQALSKQIQILEEEVGAKLLERDNKGLILTEAGKKVLEIYEPILRDWHRGEDDLRKFVKYKKNTLRLGYFNGLSYKRAVAPIMDFFEREYPEIQIDMQAADVGEILKLLDEDRIDLAVFMSFHPQPQEGPEYISLFEEPMKIVVSNHHPWYKKEHIGADDMQKESMLVFENRPLHGMESFLPDIVVKERIPVQNMDTYMGMLERGKAFGIISDLHTRVEGDFKLFLLPEEYAMTTRLAIAYKKQHPLKKIIKRLQEIKIDI